MKSRDERYNCNDCMYANPLEDGSINCDKRVLLTGKMYKVEGDKTNLPCPSHSDYPLDDWRYGSGSRLLRDSEDACEVCGRLVNLLDITQYGYIETQNEDGSKGTEKLQCKICRMKGRR